MKSFEMVEFLKLVAEKGRGIAMKSFETVEFLKLVAENPELPIVPMVDTECVADDGWSWWLAKMGTPGIDWYYVSDERVYLKSLDFDTLIEEFIDNNYDDEPYKSMTQEELEQEAKRVAEGHVWTKAIMLPIEAP